MAHSPAPKALPNSGKEIQLQRTHPRKIKYTESLKSIETSWSCGSEGNPGIEFNHIDCYRLRSGLIEIVEELKLRRNNDTDSEEKIKTLVQEKYEVERHLESKSSDLEKQNQEHVKTLIQSKRKHEDEIKVLMEKMRQDRLSREGLEEEIKALKDEIRSLQLSQYLLEKQTHEQERKIHLQTEKSEQHLHQLSSVENKVQCYTKYCHKLFDNQNRLQNNVKEAVNLNRSLMYVNQHQKCLLSQQEQEIKDLKGQLLEAMTSSRKQETPMSSVDIDLKVNRLQQQLQHKDEEIEELQKEVGETKKFYDSSLQKIDEAHQLIQRHLSNSMVHKEEATLLREKKALLEDDNNSLRKSVDSLTSELKNEQAMHKTSVDEFTTHIQQKKEAIDNLKEELEKSGEACEQLQVLNSSWSQQNLELSKSLSEAKAILEVPKYEANEQTELSLLCMEDTECQTEIQTISRQSQTEMTLTRTVPVQTIVPGVMSSLTQTERVLLKIASTQTVDAPVMNTAVQACVESEEKCVQVQTHSRLQGLGDCSERVMDSVLHDERTSVSVCESSSQTTFNMVLGIGSTNQKPEDKNIEYLSDQTKKGDSCKSKDNPDVHTNKKWQGCNDLLTSGQSEGIAIGDIPVADMSEDDVNNEAESRCDNSSIDKVLIEMSKGDNSVGNVGNQCMINEGERTVLEQSYDNPVTGKSETFSDCTVSELDRSDVGKKRSPSIENIRGTSKSRETNHVSDLEGALKNTNTTNETDISMSLTFDVQPENAKDIPLKENDLKHPFPTQTADKIYVIDDPIPDKNVYPRKAISKVSTLTPGLLATKPDGKKVENEKRGYDVMKTWTRKDYCIPKANSDKEKLDQVDISPGSLLPAVKISPKSTSRRRFKLYDDTKRPVSELPNCSSVPQPKPGGQDSIRSKTNPTLQRTGKRNSIAELLDQAVEEKTSSMAAGRSFTLSQDDFQTSTKSSTRSAAVPTFSVKPLTMPASASKASTTTQSKRSELHDISYRSTRLQQTDSSKESVQNSAESGDLSPYRRFSGYFKLGLNKKTKGASKMPPLKLMKGSAKENTLENVRDSIPDSYNEVSNVGTKKIKGILKDCSQQSHHSSRSVHFPASPVKTRVIEEELSGEQPLFSDTEEVNITDYDDDPVMATITSPTVAKKRKVD